MLKRPLLCVLLVAALVGTACGGDAGDELIAEPAAADPASPSASPAPSPSPSPSPSPTGPVSPLTGDVVVDPDADLDRRVLAVKIDNHWNARPQTGLDIADAVVELPVEAGLTRFIALFHSTDSDRVGPVRSGRPTDPTLVLPFGGTLVISGAQYWVIDGIQDYGVGLIGDIGGGVTYRSSARRAPHNLYADTAAARAVADRRGYDDAPPGAMFERGELPPTGVEAADEVTLYWSKNATVRWDWTGEAYERTADGRTHSMILEDGEAVPISTDVLVILTADQYTAHPPGSGSSVPALDTTGSGEALVLADGKVARGTWQRDSAAEQPSLLDDDGAPLAVPPGKVWVSWFPSHRSIAVG